MKTRLEFPGTMARIMVQVGTVGHVYLVFSRNPRVRLYEVDTDETM